VRTPDTKYQDLRETPPPQAFFPYYQGRKFRHMNVCLLTRGNSKMIRSQLFGLNPRDPLTFIGSAVVLTLAAGLAGFLPALRASGVYPTTALRQE